jgi:hypothetical protein
MLGVNSPPRLFCAVCKRTQKSEFTKWKSIRNTKSERPRILEYAYTFWFVFVVSELLGLYDGKYFVANIYTVGDENDLVLPPWIQFINK